MMTAPLLETRGLTRRFGGVTAVNNVDFSLARGELRCLIGPNGAGKSTFFKMLCGQLRPSEGSVHLRGDDITGSESDQIARKGVGIKTQVPSLFDGLSVRENIELAALRMHNKRATTEIASGLLDQLILNDIAGTPVGNVAHGQRQWVELAMVLATDPELILLDEPTAGMTHDEVGRTAELLLEINRDHSLIIVEHDMQFIRMIAQTVTVFHQGQILVEDDVGQILSDQRVKDVYLGKRSSIAAGSSHA